MEELFQVTVQQEDGATVVRAVGEIDVSTAPELRARLHELDESATVVVDLSEVTFLDSTGLGVLVATLKRIRESEAGGDLRLVVTRPQVSKVLDVTGLATVFSVFPSLDAALNR